MAFQRIRPPYPPTPFPHASGGKGAIRHIPVFDSASRFIAIFTLLMCYAMPKMLVQLHGKYFRYVNAISENGDIRDHPFPPLAWGERAGDRGDINLQTLYTLTPDFDLRNMPKTAILECRY